MYLITTLSNIFFQEHFRLTATKPLKLLYHPLILEI